MKLTLNVNADIVIDEEALNKMAESMSVAELDFLISFLRTKVAWKRQEVAV